VPFQPSNQEARKAKKAKPFRDALRIEMAAAEQGQPCSGPKGSARWKEMGGWDQMRSRLIGDNEGRPMVTSDAQHAQTGSVGQRSKPRQRHNLSRHRAHLFHALLNLLEVGPDPVTRQKWEKVATETPAPSEGGNA
jgi:hypothetical protein